MIFFTNIPNSYRGFLFKKIATYISKENATLKVLYSRISEKGRNFDLSEAFEGYNYFLDKNGIYFCILRNYHIHFNPVLILYCLKMLLKKKTIILSASWWNLNNLIIIFFSKFIQIFMLEVHGKIGYWMEESPKVNKENFLIKNLKIFIYGKVDFFIVPGDFSKKKVKNILLKYSSKTKKQIFNLPNLIDTVKFSGRNLQQERKSNKTIQILIVARLDDKRKGITKFIKSISNSKCFRENFNINIVGEGPDNEKIKKCINEEGISTLVNLLGNCKYDEVSNLMKEADVFCLPSFLDPSPLSLVEAAFSGLPLIASKYCGNNKELLEHKNNGYLIDPLNSQTSVDAINWIYNNKEKLGEKGKLSREIAKRNYEPDAVIKKLIFSMKKSNYLQ